MIMAMWAGWRDVLDLLTFRQECIGDRDEERKTVVSAHDMGESAISGYGYLPGNR